MVNKKMKFLIAALPLAFAIRQTPVDEPVYNEEYYDYPPSELQTDIEEFEYPSITVKDDDFDYTELQTKS